MLRLLDYRLVYFITTILLVYTFAIGWEVNSHQQLPELMKSHGHFFFIGLTAAIIANATGAGGGIVFFPAFVTLGLSTTEALATSLAIQCFGMTAGSLGWLRIRNKETPAYQPQWRPLLTILLISTPVNLFGLWLAQWLLPQPGFSVHIFFSLFSLMVGTAILLPRQGD